MAERFLSAVNCEAVNINFKLPFVSCSWLRYKSMAFPELVSEYSMRFSEDESVLVEL